MQFRLCLVFCAALASSLAVSGCADDPYATPLYKLDLADTYAVAQAASKLSLEDQGVFKTFALRHSARTAFACGNTKRHTSGEVPETIGEAVALTRKWEAEDAAKRAQNRSTLPSLSKAEEQFEQELEQLRAEFRVLSDRRASIEASSLSGDYESYPEWQEVSAQIGQAITRIEAKVAAKSGKVSPSLR